jgi:MFS transporter, DHA3 family, macrolide efflux protein
MARSKAVAQASNRIGYTYLWTNRTFGYLWAAQGISNLGDVLYDVAVVWYILETTGSALAAGGVAVGATAGRLVGNLVAGTVLDRVPARRIMLWTDLTRFVLTLGVSIGWLFGVTPSLVLLYGLAFAVSLSTGFFSPARASAIPQIVPRENLLGANAIDSVSNGAVSTFAWAASGIIVAVFGPANALLLDAVSFAVSYGFVYAARWEAVTVSGSATNPFVEAFSGIRWARQEPLIRTVLGAETLHALAMGFFLAALPLFVKELGGDASLYGMQGGMFWGGLILASFAIGYKATHRIGLLYAGGVFLNAIGSTLVGLSPRGGWLLGAVFIGGLGAAAWFTGRQSLLQAQTPVEVRGRVFALLEMLHLAIGTFLLLTHTVQRFTIGEAAQALPALQIRDGEA